MSVDSINFVLSYGCEQHTEVHGICWKIVFSPIALIVCVMITRHTNIQIYKHRLRVCDYKRLLTESSYYIGTL